MDIIDREQRELLDTPHVYETGDSADERALRALVERELKELGPEAALENLRGTAHSVPEDTLLHLVGVLEKFAGRADQAEQSLSRALVLRERRGNDTLVAQTLIVLSHLRWDAGDLVGAQAMIERAIRLAPDLPSGHINLMSLLDEIGNETELVRAFHRLGRAIPNWRADPHLRNQLLLPKWRVLSKTSVGAANSGLSAS